MGCTSRRSDDEIGFLCGDHSMKLPQTGGCQCGQVRYEITEEPQLVYTCHCLDCQRLTGTAFSLGVVVPEKGLHLTGFELRQLQRTADSGRVNTRLVCPECGSWICGMPRGGVSASGAARWITRPGCGPRGTFGFAASSRGSCSRTVMKSSRGSLPDKRGPFTTALVRGVPDDRGGRALRDHSFSHRLHRRDHSPPVARAAPGRDDVSAR